MSEKNENLSYYFEYDRIALNRPRKHKLISYIRILNDPIWKYQIIMRKLKYCRNPIRRL